MENPPSSPAPNRFVRGLLRILLVAACGVLIGFIVFIGLAYLARQVVAPLNSNTERLSALETGQAAQQSQIDDRLAQFSQRLATLENQRTADAESISAMQGGALALQQAIQDQTTRLQTIDQLQTDMTSYRQLTEYMATQVMGMRFTQTAETSPVLDLRRDLTVLRVQELINRSRMFMIQANYGSAAQDAISARQALVDLRSQAAAYQLNTLDSWIARMDLVVANLPGSPVTASDDLEIAWRLMSAGLPGIETPTPFTSGNEGVIPLTPTPTPYLTPTPGPAFDRNPSSTPYWTPSPTSVESPTPSGT